VQEHYFIKLNYTCTPQNANLYENNISTDYGDQVTTQQSYEVLNSTTAYKIVSVYALSNTIIVRM